MRLTIESTPELALANGLPVRVWTGTTEGGNPVMVLVTRIAAPTAEGSAELERELTEPPTRAVCSPEAPRPITDAERQALNALHRWLHSPFGDDMLIEAAQEFHEQAEMEAPEECVRLQEEERLAYGLAMRELVEQSQEPACRVCGCTENDCRGCIERTGRPCMWVEADLCSACVGAKP